MTLDHPDFLRSPDSACKPDPRNEGFIFPVGTPVTISVQYDDVAELDLHGGVPDDIRAQFETTKNLYLYSWFVYRFFPVSQHYSLVTLEFALRNRFEAEIIASGIRKRKHGPGLETLLKHAIVSGHLKNEGFQDWRHRTEMRARQRTSHEVIEKMIR